MAAIVPTSPDQVQQGSRWSNQNLFFVRNKCGMQTRLLLLQLFIMQVIIVYKLCTQQMFISMRKHV